MFLLKVLKATHNSRKPFKMSSQEVAQLQNSKFTRLVQYINSHSPFYKQLIQEYKIDINNCTINDFPILTESVIEANWDKIITNQRLVKHSKSTNHYHNSGRNFNKPVIYSKDDYIDAIAAYARILDFKANTNLVYFGLVNTSNPEYNLVKAINQTPTIHNSVLYLNILDNYESNLTKLEKYSPDVIFTNGFGLIQLAQSQSKDEIKLRPSVLICAGESLTPEQSKLIFNQFGVYPINIYMTKEFPILGHSLNAWNNKLMLNEDNYIVESRPNDTIVTSLSNTTFPLIRYQLEDKLTKVKLFPNGLPFQQVSNTIYNPNKSIHLTNTKGETVNIDEFNFSNLIDDNVTNFNINLLSNTSFECFIESLVDSPEIITRSRKIISEYLNSQSLSNVVFYVKRKNKILPDPINGKITKINQKAKVFAQNS